MSTAPDSNAIALPAEPTPISGTAPKAKAAVPTNNKDSPRALSILPPNGNSLNLLRANSTRELLWKSMAAENRRRHKLSD
jgi:hypothetical protein